MLYSVLNTVVTDEFGSTCLHNEAPADYLFTATFLYQHRLGWRVHHAWLWDQALNIRRRLRTESIKLSATPSKLSALFYSPRTGRRCSHERHDRTGNRPRGVAPSLQ